MKFIRIRTSKINLSNFLAYISVKRNSLKLIKHFLNILLVFGRSKTPFWGLTCKRFLKKIKLIYKTQGAPGLVKRLKASSVIYQQSLSKYNVPDISPRIARSKSGLPAIIPAEHRKLILQDDVATSKMWSTLFSIFRDISYPGTLKLSTITNSNNMNPCIYELWNYVPYFTKLFFIAESDKVLTMKSPFSITTSSPQSSSQDGTFSTHPDSIMRSLKLYLENYPDQWNHLLILCKSYIGGFKLIEFFDRLTSKFRSSPIILTEPISPYLGRLAIKREAAGKVRVFAMVDAILQWILQPLHKTLFKVLSRIPMDGTFDQLRPLKNLPWGSVPIYSFDLSAATDRLPISLQKAILADVYGKSFSNSWSALLLRKFKTPSKSALTGINVSSVLPDDVVYAVGQPMGALSSWAMLAITHHFIVQACAWMTGVVPSSVLFTSYAVLGDDIVIWNKTVADQYLKVLKWLDVEVNLSKSILSPSGDGLEFAKRTIIHGNDISPLPLKEVDASTMTMSQLFELMRKFKMTRLTALRLLGYGYKVDSTKNNVVNRAFDAAIAVPKTYVQLLELFKSPQTTFFNPNLFGIAKVRRALIRFVHEEFLLVQHQIKEERINLLQWSTGLYVDTLSVWGTDKARIEYLTKAEAIKSALLLTEQLVSTSNFILNQTNFKHLIEFNESFMWEYPATQDQESICAPSTLMALKFIFEGHKELTAMSINTIIDSSATVSQNPTDIETKRTIALWNKWQRIIKRNLLI
jgi:tRNA pseudouridine-54 N-methylase